MRVCIHHDQWFFSQLLACWQELQCQHHNTNDHTQSINDHKQSHAMITHNQYETELFASQLPACSRLTLRYTEFNQQEAHHSNSNQTSHCYRENHTWTSNLAGYCCEVQIFATVLKWPLAEISAIAEFARHEADSSSRNFCESSLHLQISQKFGPRTHNPLYGMSCQAERQACLCCFWII